MGWRQVHNAGAIFAAMFAISHGGHGTKGFTARDLGVLAQKINFADITAQERFQKGEDGKSAGGFLRHQG
jgi:hypothetical protein